MVRCSFSAGMPPISLSLLSLSDVLLIIAHTDLDHGRERGTAGARFAERYFNNYK